MVEAFITDFSHARKSSSHATMDYEIAELCAHLDIKSTTTKVKEMVVEGSPTVEPIRSTRIREAAARKAANDKHGISEESRRQVT
jgi:hypothetical protein